MLNILYNSYNVTAQKWHTALQSYILLLNKVHLDEVDCTKECYNKGFQSQSVKAVASTFSRQVSYVLLSSESTRPSNKHKDGIHFQVDARYRYWAKMGCIWKPILLRPKLSHLGWRRPTIDTRRSGLVAKLICCLDN